MTSEAARRPWALSRAGRWTGALSLAVSLLVGCAAGPSGPREYLDETTAATITVGERSLVFALDRAELGVHARDYVTLTTVDVNTSGAHHTYMVGYAWSTLDQRALDPVPASYEFVADDRVLPLQSMPDGFDSLGIHRPPTAVPARHALPLASPITGDGLVDALDGTGLRVVRTRGGVVERFMPWRESAPRP